MDKKLHLKYINLENELDAIINNFDNSGKPFGNQQRNSLRLFKINDETINVKSFKIPNLINKVVYRFFRKSKAQRSFEYANTLNKLDIGTPQPIAYYEKKSTLFFKESFYLSIHQEYDLTYRELVSDENYPNHETILRQFTRFTYKLHENNICFLDHSPGNTLIKKEGDNYQFYLVDLNRMHFKKLSFDQRMANFSRLTPKKEMVAVMSNEYAKLIKQDYEIVFAKMWDFTTKFQEKHHRKKRLKKQLLGRK
jgi:tRNA A-37 threonylcarbamoyl transferase component Bud32